MNGLKKRAGLTGQIPLPFLKKTQEVSLFLYFYKGVGFYFDNQLIEQVKNMIGDLQRELGLSGDTRILAGPKKKVITGKEYPQKYLGTIRELTA